MGGAAAKTDAPAVLTPRIHPGYLGTVNVVRPLVVEVVVILVLATLGQPAWLLVTVTLFGFAATVLALARAGGRWWTERVGIRSRYRRRRATVPDPGGDSRLRALRALAPGLRVVDVASADGVRTGVGADPAGWFAAAALLPGSGYRPEADLTLPFDRLARLIADAGQPGAVLQVVVHTSPAPSGALDPRQRCAKSYQELLDRYGPVPTSQSVWIAVRLDAQALAAAGVSGTEAARQAPAAVAALARRVHRALDRSGIPVTLLDSDGLVEALVEACDLGAGPPDRVGREDWQGWTAGRLAHTCYWVRRWPAAESAGQALRALTTPSTAGTAVAVMLEPGEDGLELRCLVRLSAAADHLAQAATALTEVAQRAGVQLLRLDGEHAPAVYATAPTGGGAR